MERLEREHGRVVITKHGRPSVIMPLRDAGFVVSSRDLYGGDDGFEADVSLAEVLQDVVGAGILGELAMRFGFREMTEVVV